MILAIIIWCCTCAGSVIAQSLQGLGDLSGGTLHSSAYGVAANGLVVVGASYSGSGYEAVRWTSGGGMVGLGDLTGGTYESRAEGLTGRFDRGRGG